MQGLLKIPAQQKAQRPGPLRILPRFSPVKTGNLPGVKAKYNSVPDKPQYDDQRH